MKWTAYLITASLLIAGVFGCESNKKEIEMANAKLDLARQKGDLDQMYLALRELKTLGEDSEEILQELSKAEKGLEIIQQLRLYKSEHEHENVVISAGEFLEIFPDHPEARRALKESGLIFSYLKTAKLALQSCFHQKNEDQPQLIEVQTDSTSSIDFSTIFYNIEKAEKAINEAKKLDLQFEHVLAMEKMITDTKNTLLLVISLSIVQTAAVQADDFIHIFNMVYHVMSLRVEYSLESPSETWNEVEPLVKGVKEASQFALDDMNKKSSYLTTYESGEALEFILTAREINIQTSELIDAITSPTGSMIDYKKDVESKIRKTRELIKRFSSSVPDEKKIWSNMFGFYLVVNDYQLFEKPDAVVPLLERYRGLYEQKMTQMAL